MKINQSPKPSSIKSLKLVWEIGNNVIHNDTNNIIIKI